MAPCLDDAVYNNLNFAFRQDIGQLPAFYVHSGIAQGGLQFAHQLRRRVKTGVAHQPDDCCDINAFFA
jgi:hypothetical protein